MPSAFTPTFNHVGPGSCCCSCAHTPDVDTPSRTGLDLGGWEKHPLGASEADILALPSIILAADSALLGEPCSICLSPLAIADCVRSLEVSSFTQGTDAC